MTGRAKNTKAPALLSLSAALFAWSGSAAAEEDLGEQAECVRAYEAAQERRAANDLVQARDELKICLKDHCRDFIRSACSQWLEEVEATLPSVVFNVKQDGRDVSEVKVYDGDRLLAESLTGQSLELNPGKYSFRFEAAGAPEVTREILLRAGELNRVVAVELESAAPKPAPPPDVPPPLPAADRPLVVPIALFATGAFALGSFATFGALGLSQESELEQRCAPACDPSELDSVRTKYLIADVSLGIGVVALIAGGYFLFRPLEAAEAPPKSSSLRFDLKSHRHGGFATLSGRF